MKKISVEQVAEICHEANRAYSKSIGEEPKASWGDSSDAIKKSAIDGVLYRWANPEVSPADMHNNWLAFKQEQGYVYGEKIDNEAKTHPCIVEYSELPEEQKIKDSLFISIVSTFQNRITV